MWLLQYFGHDTTAVRKGYCDTMTKNEISTNRYFHGIRIVIKIVIDMDTDPLMSEIEYWFYSCRLRLTYDDSFLIDLTKYRKYL